MYCTHNTGGSRRTTRRRYACSFGWEAAKQHPEKKISRWGTDRPTKWGKRSNLWKLRKRMNPVCIYELNFTFPISALQSASAQALLVTDNCCWRKLPKYKNRHPPSHFLPPPTTSVEGKVLNGFQVRRWFFTFPSLSFLPNPDEWQCVKVFYFYK